MWRRACQGEQEAVVALAVLVFAPWWLAVVVVATHLGWGRAALFAALTAVVSLTTYVVRRHAWNRWFRTQSEEAVAAFEALLGRPDDRAE